MTWNQSLLTTGASTALAVLAFGGGLLAHDFWLQPSSFAPAINTPVRVHFRVGDHFAGEPVGRNGDKLIRFFSVAPSGEVTDVVGMEGADPAGVTRFSAPGLYTLAYHGRPSTVSLEARAFEAYLKEEGLERIIAERAARGESAAPGRELFARSVKAFVRAGPGSSSAGYDRAVGLPLEIVPEADPFAGGIRALPVRLLADGKPLAGALLVVLRKDSPTSGKGVEISTARTDGDGRAMLELAPGFLLIKAVHMVRADAASGADWSSTWTSLTFETTH
jgi:hypothetical protein